MNDKWMAFFFSLIFFLFIFIYFILIKPENYIMNLLVTKESFFIIQWFTLKNGKIRKPGIAGVKLVGLQTCRELWMTRNRERQETEESPGVYQWWMPYELMGCPTWIVKHICAPFLRFCVCTSSLKQNTGFSVILGTVFMSFRLTKSKLHLIQILSSLNMWLLNLG